MATSTSPLDRLRLGTGIAASERDTMLRRFAPLEAHLQSVNNDSLDMELSIKERDSMGQQQVTFELWSNRTPHLVATSQLPDLTDALNDVRDDMIRRVRDVIDRYEAARVRPAQ